MFDRNYLYFEYKVCYLTYARLIKKSMFEISRRYQTSVNKPTDEEIMFVTFDKSVPMKLLLTVCADFIEIDCFDYTFQYYTQTKWLLPRRASCRGC